MKKITITGVPEHFNFPWQMAIEEGAFSHRGIDLLWTDVPEGTGKMCQMLRNGETDISVILTEGIVKSIVEGNPVKIVQEFIASPLKWGIHVGAESSHKTLSDLENGIAAISRLGSGSHLMAYVNARNQGWNPESLRFEIVDHLDGAIKALTSGGADYFMWEHFMTKPLVDKGVFRRLGDCPTPWPSFVIAARADFIADNRGALKHILDVINGYTSEFKSIPSIDRTLANHYGLDLNDIRQWLSMTRWSQSNISSQTIEKVLDTLLDLNLISNKIDLAQIVQV
jgi:ABC-type nitrate/sulfonate/bicarbonate transport system substrate-binding protein